MNNKKDKTAYRMRTENAEVGNDDDQIKKEVMESILHSHVNIFENLCKINDFLENINKKFQRNSNITRSIIIEYIK